MDVLLAPVREEHVELSLIRNQVQIPIELQVETLPERFQGDLKQETNEPRCQQPIHLNQSEAGTRFDQPISERKTAIVPASRSQSNIIRKQSKEILSASIL